MTAKNGRPCKRCGTSEWNSTRDCMECARERTHQWQINNPEKHRAHSRTWNANNQLRVRETGRLWRAKNPEIHRGYAKRWDNRNPEAKRSHKQARRARKAQAEGHYTADDWKAIVTAQGGKCLACGKKTKLTVDHVIPLSKGGTNWPDNIQGLCSSCNSKKSTGNKDYRAEGGIVRWIQQKLFG